VGSAKSEISLGIHAGDHVATSFKDDSGFIGNTVDFARRGLSQRARVLVFSTPTQLRPLRDHLCRSGGEIAAAVEVGQLQVLDPAQVQLAIGHFDPDYLRRTWAAATNEAVADGHTGLWVSVDMTWANPRAVDTDALVRFEAELNTLFATGQFTAICQYDERQFSGDDIRRACAAHPHNARGSTFRHYITDDGTFLVAFGEADLSNRAAWTVIVNSMAGHSPVIDIAAMTFLDVRAMATIGVAAARRRDTTVIATPNQAWQLRLTCRSELEHLTIHENPRPPHTFNQPVPCDRGPRANGTTTTR
jgi:hypothetical protein